MSNRNLILQALSAGDGIVRLAPCWVPRSFLMPGGRLKLDPRDLYALGAHRGGIDERWFSSTTKADNGPLTAQDEGDNGMLYHSRAYKLKPGSGWQIDAGILHAPGSLLTYEPQVNSDVFAMYQSMVEGRAVPWDLLVKDVPPDHHHDLDYLLDQMDLEANTDPAFYPRRKSEPRPVALVQ